LAAAGIREVEPFGRPRITAGAASRFVPPCWKVAAAVFITRHCLAPVLPVAPGHFFAHGRGPDPRRSGPGERTRKRIAAARPGELTPRALGRSAYRSSGLRPVCLAIRASILGPISSPLWKGKATSGHPSRLSVRCEPDCRFAVHQTGLRRPEAGPAARPIVISIGSCFPCSPCSICSASTRRTSAAALRPASSALAP
jgi:hypothetical protein